MGGAGIAASADEPWIGRFEGTGRACSGALSMEATVLSWRWQYGDCRARHYEVLDATREQGAPRLVARLPRPRGARCPYEVIELEQADTYAWNVTGFPSLEAYEKKGVPAWRDSPLPSRYVLSCLMTKVR